MWVLFLAVAPTATAEAVAMFPGLRKRLEKQKMAATQLKAVEPEEESDDGPETATAEVGPARPAVVPAAVDAGQDGFPTLPSVSTMLSDASVSLKAVSSQASSLQARVVQAQMMSESKMAKQKAAFDEKLKQQEQENRKAIQANDAITAAINTLKGDNAALKKHAHEIEDSNHAMRSEMKSLQGRLGVGKDFTAKSLTSTDDSKAALLQVLHGNPRHPKKALVEMSSSSKSKHDDDDEADDDKESTDEVADASDDKSTDDKDEDDSDDKATTFLAISSKVHRESDGTASFESAMAELDSAVPTVSLDSAASTSASSPGDLLDILSKDVSHLAEQEKESEKTLKQMFIKDFRAGAKRHAALLAQQKGLTSTRTSLQKVQDKLKTAVDHLESMNMQLAGKLHGLGQYLQKLAHFAMAPQKEVAHLGEALPKVVTAKVEKKPVV